MNKKIFSIVILFLFIIVLLPAEKIAFADENNVNVKQCFSLPEAFDLRDFNGENFVSSIKSQSGGTCWTHGAFASIESNLLMTRNWEKVEESTEPNLAEYHLDWWNGFNTFNNLDDPNGPGLEVHYGGDYLVTSAYCSRGDGPVREEDGQSFITPPEFYEETYHIYYPRDIEWYTVGVNLENIDAIKESIMKNGALGTCMAYGAATLFNWSHFYNGLQDPNHAIAIIGWDDNKITLAKNPGAWLCKNSWGSNWGLDGYFWISYYDSHAGNHPEMGAVSFQNVEPQPYKKIYYHDYHGWRDTMENCTEAFNKFTSKSNDILSSVSFYTAEDNVNYEIRIFDDFEDNNLKNEFCSFSGIINYRGFHTVDLSEAVKLQNNDDFYVYLYLSNGGHPYDCTSEIPVLLGTNSVGTKVISKANPGESYFRDVFGNWIDLTSIDDSANFCIKALVPKQSDLSIGNHINIKNVKPGENIEADFFVENIGQSFSKLNWEIISYPEWGSWNFSAIAGDGLLPEDGKIKILVNIETPNEQNQDFSGELLLINKYDGNDIENVEVRISTINSHRNLNILKFFSYSLEHLGLRFVQIINGILPTI